MTTYLINTVLCSLLLLLFYRAALARERMLRFNRAYLLGALVLSIVLPAITITFPGGPLPGLADGNAGYTAFLEGIEINGTSGTGWPVAGTILATIYWLATACLLAAHLADLAAIAIRISRSQVVKRHGVKLVLSDRVYVPYSFMNYIFLNRGEYERGLIEDEVLAHEIAHIRQGHSADRLLVGLLTVFWWFNPALYFYRKAIYLNHEYLADNAVVASTGDLANYQHLLIYRFNKPEGYSLTSPFGFLTIKKRLIMMNKKLSKRRALAKSLAAIPLLAVAFALFCCSGGGAENKTDDTVVKTEFQENIEDVFTVVEQMPRFDGQDAQAFMQHMSRSIVYPEECKKEKVQGRVLVSFVIDKRGKLTQVRILESPDRRLSEYIVNLLENSPARWEPGRQRGQAVNVKLLMPFTFRLG